MGSCQLALTAPPQLPHAGAAQDEKFPRWGAQRTLSADGRDARPVPTILRDATLPVSDTRADDAILPILVPSDAEVLSSQPKFRQVTDSLQLRRPAAIVTRYPDKRRSQPVQSLQAEPSTERRLSSHLSHLAPQPPEAQRVRVPRSQSTGLPQYPDAVVSSVGQRDLARMAAELLGVSRVISGGPAKRLYPSGPSGSHSARSQSPRSGVSPSEVHRSQIHAELSSLEGSHSRSISLRLVQSEPQLQQAGADSPKDEAAVLMSQAQHFRRQLAKSRSEHSPVPSGLASPRNPRQAFRYTDLEPRTSIEGVSPRMDFLDEFGLPSYTPRSARSIKGQKKPTPGSAPAAGRELYSSVVPAEPTSAGPSLLAEPRTPTPPPAASMHYMPPSLARLMAHRLAGLHLASSGAQPHSPHSPRSAKPDTASISPRNKVVRPSSRSGSRRADEISLPLSRSAVQLSSSAPVGSAATAQPPAQAQAQLPPQPQFFSPAPHKSRTMPEIGTIQEASDQSIHTSHGPARAITAPDGLYPCPAQLAARPLSPSSASMYSLGHSSHHAVRHHRSASSHALVSHAVLLPLPLPVPVPAPLVSSGRSESASSGLYLNPQPPDRSSAVKPDKPSPRKADIHAFRKAAALLASASDRPPAVLPALSASAPASLLSPSSSSSAAPAPGPASASASALVAPATVQLFSPTAGALSSRMRRLVKKERERERKGEHQRERDTETAIQPPAPHGQPDAHAAASRPRGLGAERSSAPQMLPPLDIDIAAALTDSLPRSKSHAAFGSLLAQQPDKGAVPPTSAGAITGPPSASPLLPPL